MRTETWQNKVNTCIKYHIIHPFFHDTCISYGTTFPLKLTSVSDVSTTMYSAVEFTFYFSAKSICKVMGMRCIRNKRLGAALTWFLRSKVSFKLLILPMSIHCVSVGLSLILFSFFDFVGCGICYSSCWKVWIPKSLKSVFSISFKG